MGDKFYKYAFYVNGFNIIEPTDGDDICPCLVDDGWYSWMPEDNFYCGRGERRTE